MSQQLFIQEHAVAFALVVGAIGANLALEWFVTARERMADAGGRGRAAVLGGTLIEVRTSRTGAGPPDDFAVGVPLLGHLPRIRVEERAMAGALGQEWVGYAAGTAPIVPGVW